MKVLFLHGLESGPFGTKYTYLKNVGLDVFSPDMTGKNIDERVSIVKPIIKDFDVVVGSSFGGLTAALCSHNDMKAVLLAPAFNMIDYKPNVLGKGFIIHSPTDGIVPINTSKDFVSNNKNWKLIEVDDDHRLNNHLVLIVYLINLL